MALSKIGSAGLDTLSGNLIVNGNLGVGTASPATPLDVTKSNSGNFVATFQNTNASTPYGVFIKDAPSGANGYPLLQVTNSAGAHYFRVDSGTGYVTTPYQPAFLARKTSSQVVSDGNTDVVIYPTTVNQTGSAWDGNSRFTAPVNGWYFVSTQVNFLPNGQNYAGLTLYKNGLAFYIHDAVISPTLRQNLTPSGMVYCAAGDYLEFKFASSGAATTLDNAGTFSARLAG